MKDHSSVKSVAVVVNGTIENPLWAKKIISDSDFVIGVDGGSNHLLTMDIVPDLIVGDLDSISADTRRTFTDKGCSFMTFPSAKDQSDLQLALEHAATFQPDVIRLLGALGKRFDHTYGNVLLLNRLEDQSIHVVIEDELHEIQIISKRKDYLQMAGDILSLFSLTAESTGIVTQGMAYPLRDETLYLGDTRGLSNEIKDPEAAVSLKSGRLLAIRIKTAQLDE